MNPDTKKNQQKQTSDADDNKSGSNSKESTVAAHEQADKDIAEDADLSIHSPNDDLDEGETARLGEDNTELI